MYTAYWGGSATIANHADTSWRLTIGNNFGVNNQGNLYATGGEIGGW